MPNSPAKPKSKRPEIHAADWEDLITLMAQRGVTGSTADLFHALIQAFKLGDLEQQHQTRTVSELTSSLNWFTDRIDNLEKTCDLLKQERDRLKVSGTVSDELEQLRNENAQLKHELQQTRSQLQGIQKLLGIEANGIAVPAISTSTPTHTPVAQIAANDHTASTPAVTVAQQKEPKAEAVTRRNRGETIDKISQIVDALLSWNTSQEDSAMQLRISIPTIKGLASAMGANYQHAIQEVLKERAEELEEHHGRLMIGTRHNAGVGKKDEVLKEIAQNYLGLDNWQQVKYQG
jgi:predicted DNA binding CopG/RHH family protein